MQNTPFRDIQHHEDGRHIFTVRANDDIKRFGTTDTIDAAKALRNALAWRNSVIGGTVTSTDEAAIARFAKSIAEPIAGDVPIRSVKKVEDVKRPPVKQVKVQQLPFGVRRTSEANIEKAVKTGRPKVTEVERRKKCKSAINEPSKRRPSLPNGVTVFRNGGNTVVFGVNYMVGDKRRMRQFHIGKPQNFTLEKYRMQRHVAICFRKEFLMSVVENRPMNVAAFENPRKQIREGTFPWPFTGTITRKEVKPRGNRRPDEFHLDRIQATRTVKPSLPKGVGCYIMKNNSNHPQVVFQVVYTDEKMRRRIKSFYVSLVGQLELPQYRIARHAAICLRKEYVDSRLENRPMRMELFDEWREKIRSGSFEWPFKGTVPALVRKTREHSIETRLNNRAGRLCKDVFAYLASQPEFGSVLANLSANRADVLTLKVAEIINEELYYTQRKKHK